MAEAGTDAEAVARARDSRADLVVMDIRVPDMNGIEATRRITADEALAGVKILILTTYETDALVAAALRAGASGYLGKGTKPDFLLHSIRTRPAAARSSADEPARA
jgi:DNA-binding NarL/FixJ family response regulator